MSQVVYDADGVMLVHLDDPGGTRLFELTDDTYHQVRLTPRQFEFLVVAFLGYHLAGVERVWIEINPGRTI